MIEVRRDLYMNEKTGEKSAQFDTVKNILQDALIKSESFKV